MCTFVKALGLLAAMIIAANPVVLGNATGMTEHLMMPTIDPEFVEMEEGFNRLNEDLGRFATKQFFPIVSEILYDTRLSSECAGGLLKLGTALRDSEIWVIQSMLTGRLAEYGAYDQCLAIRHPRNLFQGKYCMIQVNGNGKISPSLSDLVDKFLELHNLKLWFTNDA
ncbi:unnamed protein product [Ixodes pacificus]